MSAEHFPNMEPLTEDERQIVEANVGLVGWVCNRSGINQARWEDAYQDGMFGLMRAAQKFDGSKGFRFSTYATWWIKQAIQRGKGIEDGSNERRAQRNGTSMTAALSLDREYQREDFGTPTLGDVLASGDDPATAAIRTADSDAGIHLVHRAGKDETDRTIVDMLSQGATRRQIAETVGLTPEAVRRRTERLKSRLNHPTSRLRNEEHETRAC